jgi:hypothetical protein
MQDYVAGGIVGYIVGWISALLAIASVERVDLAVRHAARRRDRSRRLRFDAAPIAARGPVRIWTRLRDGLRGRPHVPTVPALRQGPAGLGPDDWCRRDQHTALNQAWLTEIQAKGYGIDELQLEKR